MQPKATAQCLALLRAMNGPAWDDSQQALYEFLLDTWDDETGRAAVRQAVLAEKWRPSVAELRQNAARLASPLPSAEAAYAEVTAKERRYGFNARRDPDRPHVFLPGEPEWSHPIVGRAVRWCGGWRGVCAGDMQFQAGGESGAFKAVYEKVRQEWLREVAAQLSLPAAERDPALFAPYAPFEGASLALPPPPPRPQHAGLAAPRTGAEEVPMPAPLRERLAVMGIGQARQYLSPQPPPLRGEGEKDRREIR